MGLNVTLPVFTMLIDGSKFSTKQMSKGVGRPEGSRTAQTRHKNTHFANSQFMVLAGSIIWHDRHDTKEKKPG